MKSCGPLWNFVQNSRAFFFQLTGSGRGRNRRFRQVPGSDSWEADGACEIGIPSCESTEAIELWLPAFNSTPIVGSLRSLFSVVVCLARDGVSIITEKCQILLFPRGKMKNTSLGISGAWFRPTSRILHLRKFSKKNFLPQIFTA